VYSGKAVLYIRALTPLHVGVGRGYAVHVELPIQRDEFGYPAIWASSLKGAIRANLPSDFRRCLGSEPGVVPTSPSQIAFMDARLLLVPARVLNGVYAYVTSPTLLRAFYDYLDVVELKVSYDASLLKETKAVSSRKELLYNGKVVVNETSLEARVDSDLASKLGLDKALPKEILDDVVERGLILLPDINNVSLRVVNKSVLIQYRVRLKRESKTVEEGPWSEEYLPAYSTLISIALCSENSLSNGVTCSCEELRKRLDGKVFFVGGRETIGKGLVKLIAARGGAP